MKTGIKNLIKWLPVIWKDRDWDKYYLYIILYHKLKYMEEYFNKDDIMIMYADKYAKQIKIAKNLVKRLTDNNYLNNALSAQTTFMKCCKHSDYMENQDREMLFKWLNKHIDGWWE